MTHPLDTLLLERHSVRAYKPDPVDPAIQREVFALAQRTASNCNVQPWRAYVASGAVRDRLRDEYVRAVESGEAAATEDAIPNFEGDYRTLQVACAVEMYGHMGVARGDKEGRTRAFMRNYQLFDAPHVAILGMHESFGLGVALDVGMWIQSVLLLFASRGIGTCPMASLRSHPRVVRDVLGVPPDIRILCGIAFGYEDEAAGVNRTRQPRSPLEQNVVFLG